jgi:hypothetical protein
MDKLSIYNNYQDDDRGRRLHVFNLVYIKIRSIFQPRIKLKNSAR